MLQTVKKSGRYLLLFENNKEFKIGSYFSITLYIPRKNDTYIKYLDINTINKNYQVKHFPQYSLFLKREFNDREIEDVESVCVNNDSTFADQTVTRKKSSFFSRLFRFFSEEKKILN